MGYSNCSPCDPCGTDQNAAKAAAYARMANTYATNAENSWLEFNALYLGAFAVAPTADNEGNPLQNGALYWNLGSNTMFVWNGSVWVENGNFDEFTNFMLPSATPIPAANLVTGQEYEIAVVGTTNWTAIGAASATVGVRFTKNAVAATGTGTARVTRDLVTRFADVINVKDFGAVGDQVADDTAAIQAAINAANLVRGYVMSPSGNSYRITDSIIIDRDRLTIDFNNCGLVLDDPSGLKDIIKIGNGSTVKNEIEIKNIVFGKFQAATAGYAINLNKAGNVDIEGCYIYGDNKVYGGIKISRGIQVNIQNNLISRCLGDGIYCDGVSQPDRSIDIVIRENRIEYCYNGTKIWDFVEGVFYRDNIIFGNNNHGLYVDASAPANGLVSFKFQENDFDGNIKTGAFISKVTNIQFTDNWCSSNGDTGVASNLYIGADTGSAIVDGNQFYCAAGPYISVRSDGGDVVISSNLINGGQTGMLIMGTLYSITGNSLKYLTTGINLFSANKYTVTGNDFESVTTPIGVGGGSTEIVVADNGGYCVGSKNYDPPNIGPGLTDITTVTVNGANFGDIVNVSFTNHNDHGGIIIYGYVSAANTVTVRFYNPQAFAVDFPSGVINVTATKAVQI